MYVFSPRYNIEYNWDTKKIMDRKRCVPCRPVDRWFQVKDVGVNSVYAAGWSVLQQLALAINDTATAELCASEAATSAAAIISKMYVPALDGFRSLYVDWDGEEKISTPNVIQNLFPLLLPVLPQNFVAKLVDEVRSGSKFNSTFVLPTVALDDPKFCATFDADLMWRGPVWGFTNWFVMEGLQTHGYDDEVRQTDQAFP
jgi:glycogen debranching enzyme